MSYFRVAISNLCYPRPPTRDAAGETGADIKNDHFFTKPEMSKESYLQRVLANITVPVTCPKAVHENIPKNNCGKFTMLFPNSGNGLLGAKSVFLFLILETARESMSRGGLERERERERERES